MKKRSLITILVISIILFLGIILFVILTTDKEDKKEQPIEKTTNILEYLNANMISYGNKLVQEKIWFDSHKENKINEVNLYEIVKDEDFDKTIFDYIDCNYKNTKLIIEIDDTVSFDTKLDCIVNKDKTGIYYSEKKLEEKLKSYGEIILTSIKDSITKDTKIVFTLNQIKDIYKIDLSMFEENYDFEKTTLSIVISNFQNNEYNVEYEVNLVLKEK